eukprot:2952689-Rhodomonas_salina.1
MKGLRDLLGHVKPVDKSCDTAISTPPKGTVHVYFAKDVSEELFEQIAKTVLLEEQMYRKTGRESGFPYDLFSESLIRESAKSRAKHGYVLAVSSAGRKMIIDAAKITDEDSVVETILGDINECSVCCNDHPVANSSCAVCNKFVCSDCAAQMDVCPFCRGDPRWNRGLF